MRKCILIILMIDALYGYTQKIDSSFLNKLSSDFSRNSYFVCLNVIIKEKPSSVVIRNDELYFYFHEVKKMNKNSYRGCLKSLIIKNEVITVASINVKKYGFVKVEPNAKIDAVAKDGKKAILSKYFKNRVLVDGVTNTDKFYIIKLLFDWQIASRIDDESGYLVVEE